MDRGTIMEVPTPPSTETWCPIGHGTLLQQVHELATQRGLAITGEEHYLGRNGARYCGRLKVQQPGRAIVETPKDYGFFIGVRNSLDKSAAATLGFGTDVFVCANGCFSAEFILNRKHTPEILSDLPRLTAEVMDRFANHTAAVKHRYDVYKHTELSNTEAHDLIILGAENGATNYRQVPTIVSQWKAPDHPEFAEHKNAWRLFNAFTEAAKLGSEADLWDRSLKLQGLFDAHCKFDAPTREIVNSTTVGAL